MCEPSRKKTQYLVGVNLTLIVACFGTCWDVTDVRGEWWKADWKYRHSLTLTTSVRELRDFPALVVLDSTRVDYAAMEDKGADLRFVDGQGQVLSHEIEQWNTAGLSHVWVRIPRLSASGNHIWLYYGNPAAVGRQRPEDVWDSAFRGVWHFAEDPSQQPPQMKDSTSNRNHGSARRGMASTASVVSLK